MRSFRESGHRHSARNARGGENHPGWSSVTRCLRTILAPLSPSPSFLLSFVYSLLDQHFFLASVSPFPFALPSISRYAIVFRLFFLSSLSFSFTILRFCQKFLFSRNGRKCFLFVSPRNKMENYIEIIVVQRSCSRSRGSSTSMGKLASLCSGRGMVEAVHRLAP